MERGGGRHGEAQPIARTSALAVETLVLVCTPLRRVVDAGYFDNYGIDVLALKVGVDKAEIRRRNFVKAEQFPYTTSLGWTLDSGAYHPALDKVLKAVDYEGLRREQAAKRAAFKRGETRDIMGIGVSFFTETVAIGHTSIRVKIRVWAERRFSSGSEAFVTEAEATMVAVDDEGRKVPIRAAGPG